MKRNNLLAAVLASALLGLTSCRRSALVTEENTINVKLLLGGYGDAWLYELKDRFEETYADLGYKVNIVKPTTQNSGSRVLSELRSGYAKMNTDLYFTGDLQPEFLFTSGYSDLVEPLDELVYNQKALNFAGEEEEKTVLQKLDKAFGEEWFRYEGTAYTFFYQKAIGGLVVNYDKLRSILGEDTELPRTSDEFLKQIHDLYALYRPERIKYDADPSYQPSNLTAPFTLANNSSGQITGYSAVMFNSWYTQYSGLDSWNSFWSMNDEDGNYRLADGYNVFDDKGIEIATELVYKVYDKENLEIGSKNYSLAQAHKSLLMPKNKQGAVYLFDGDWALKETAIDFPEEEFLRQLRFINVPVVSALGTKLWMEDSAVADNQEQCDQMLSYVISLLDANVQSDEQIVVSVQTKFGKTITTSDVKRVSFARGVYNNRGVQTGACYIPTGLSDVHKDIAAKFLRMMASDDFAKMYFETSKCFSPYSNAIAEETTMLPFSEGHKNIALHRDATPIWPIAVGLRGKISDGRMKNAFPLKSYVHTYALENTSLTGYDTKTGLIDQANYDRFITLAKSAIADNKNECINKWPGWMAEIN